MNILVGFLFTVLFTKSVISGMIFGMGTFVHTKKCPGDGSLFSNMEKNKRLAPGSLGSLNFKTHKGYDILLTCLGGTKVKNPTSIWITTDTSRFSNHLCRMMYAGGKKYYLWVTVTQLTGDKVVYKDKVQCGYPVSTAPTAPTLVASVPIPPTKLVQSRTTKSPLPMNKPNVVTNNPVVIPSNNPPQPMKPSRPVQSSTSSQDEPILHISAVCPPRSSGSPSLHVTADVPAYAKAICKNGHKILSTTNEVHFQLAATFSQSNPGKACQFYKQTGSNTFIVEVEVGWGERGGEIFHPSLIRTITCSYDDHGHDLTEDQTISDWFLSPKEIQTLRGPSSPVSFSLKVFDVLNKEIDTDLIAMGRKIQLVATNSSGSLAGFRALSCYAENNQKSYAILRAGCGDGQIFPKSQGFFTDGNVVHSPFFSAFQLSEGDGVRFQCRFSVCTSPCDGSSCPSERKKRRSAHR